MVPKEGTTNVTSESKKERQTDIEVLPASDGAAPQLKLEPSFPNSLNRKN